MITERKCRDCKVVRPITDYHRNSGSKRDSRRRQCRFCRSRQSALTRVPSVSKRGGAYHAAAEAEPEVALLCAMIENAVATVAAGRPTRTGSTQKEQLLQWENANGWLYDRSWDSWSFNWVCAHLQAAGLDVNPDYIRYVVRPQNLPISREPWSHCDEDNNVLDWWMDKYGVQGIELARRVGTGHSLISRFRRGDLRPGIVLARKLVAEMSKIAGAKYEVDDFWPEADLNVGDYRNRKRPK